jgi:amino acid adenylation domain-containing protein
LVVEVLNNSYLLWRLKNGQNQGLVNKAFNRDNVNKNISCYIISETTLGIQCAKQLLKEEHQLLGMISAYNETQQWAKSHNIPFFSSLKDFQSLNPYKTFDYLFSIVNRQIIKKEILEYPRYCTINYHDALLPKYAGAHATSWAILNNESVHGISWHIMDEVVNGGEILKQVTFPIDQDETALSLNLKCYTHALDSFNDLIQKLEKGSLLGEKQNLRNRSYFSRSQKPSHLGFISWMDSAQDIERLYRALFLGPYPNALATFKIFINNNIFIPSKLEILSSRSQKLPGTITQITEEGINVSTKTQDIRLSHFKNSNDHACFIKDIIKKSEVSVGYTFKNSDEKVLKDLQYLSNALSTYEDFWAKEIEGILPVRVPFTSSLLIGNAKAKNDDKLAKEIIISDKFLKFSPNFTQESSTSFSETFITAFLIYLTRLGSYSPFTIGFVSFFLKNIPKNLSFFFPTFLPATFSLRANVSAHDTLEYIKGRLASVEKNKAYCEDVYVRYPKLRGFSSFLPIIIDLGSFQTEDSRLDQFPFVLTLDEKNKSYTFKIKAVQDDISKALLKNFPEHIKTLFEELIQTILSYPTKPIYELSSPTQKEEEQILVKWNQTEVFLPQNKTIQQLFEEQVEKTPSNIAVVYEDQKLTYQQLNEKSNQLAHYLRTLGVEPDTLVAISVERSLEMIIGLLGILKAGGAYVPLDPSYPQERLQFMLEDTKASILITQAHLNETFRAYSGTTLNLYLRNEEKELFIEELSSNAETSQTQRWRSLPAESSQNPESLTSPHHLAYVIYTSGSTGKPKGVMIGHNNVVRLLKKTQQWYHFTQNDVWTLFHSYAFDFSVWEIWGALSYGGKLIVVSYLTSRSPQAFYELLVKQKVTVLNQTPSAFQQLIQHEQLLNKLNLRSSHSLFTRLVIFGGEALVMDQLTPWFNMHTEGDTQFVNMYGITETTVHVTYFSISKEHTSRKENSILGKKIPDLKVYILDTQLNPVPVGVSGEIYIGGDGLARGYLNRPDLTAEKFIPNPFTNDPNTEERLNRADLSFKAPERLRLYRTGDLARYLPDGNIEFLGRIDDQVKIRGFRIELGEIESVLMQHSAVKEVVVIARENNPGDKRLVGYIVPKFEDYLSDNFTSKNIASWQAIYQDVYNKNTQSLNDLEFNTTGWNSSYTQKPIPSEEMSEWVTQSVENIMALKPKRVLEIGCGSGLLLSRIAPYCEDYWATDFSSHVFYLIEALKKQNSRLDHVKFFQRTADNFEGFEAQNFDMVVINSVVQYFPNINYLLKVLQGSINILSSPGHIFIGDIRNFSLLEAYHTSVKLFQAAAYTTKEEILHHVKKSVQLEKELTIDPLFFKRVHRYLKEINYSQIKIKKGTYHNELTRFRYDVMLYVGEQPNIKDVIWHEWNTKCQTLSRLEQILRESKLELFAIKEIPNKRLTSEMLALSWLYNEEIVFETVEDFRQYLKEISLEGINPTDVEKLAEDYKYSVILSWSLEKKDSFDAFFFAKKNTTDASKIIPTSYALKGNSLIQY